LIITGIRDVVGDRRRRFLLTSGVEIDYEVHFLATADEVEVVEAEAEALKAAMAEMATSVDSKVLTEIVAAVAEAADVDANELTVTAKEPEEISKEQPAPAPAPAPEESESDWGGFQLSAGHGLNTAFAAVALGTTAAALVMFVLV
jgi:hypothetical protein